MIVCSEGIISFNEIYDHFKVYLTNGYAIFRNAKEDSLAKEMQEY